MNSIFALLALVGTAPAPPSEADRMFPAAELAKVRKLIKPALWSKLPDKTWTSLNFEDKFVYTMIHGEYWSQNCSGGAGMVWYAFPTKIIGQLPIFFPDDTYWSPRQLAFLKLERQQVIEQLRPMLKAQDGWPVCVQNAIVDADAFELIPDLAAKLGPGTGDRVILTLLANLMYQDKYRPFLKTSACKELFRTRSSDHGYIAHSAANEKLLLGLAMGYYHSRVK